MIDGSVAGIWQNATCRSRSRRYGKTQRVAAAARQRYDKTRRRSRSAAGVWQNAALQPQQEIWQNAACRSRGRDMTKRGMSQPRQEIWQNAACRSRGRRYDKTRRVAAAAGDMTKRGAPAAVQHETEKPHRRRALAFRFLFFIQTKVRFFVKKVQFFLQSRATIG